MEPCDNQNTILTPNWILALAKTKVQISCAVTARLISAFVFTSQIDHSTIPLRLTSEILSYSLSSAQMGLWVTWLETQKTGFHALRLICRLRPSLIFKHYLSCGVCDSVDAEADQSVPRTDLKPKLLDVQCPKGLMQF